MSMLINLLFFFSGCLITSIIFYTIRNKKKPQKDPYIRKGIYKRSFNVTSLLGEKSQMDVEFEVGEMESSHKKSKIKILSIWVSQSKHDCEDHREKIKSMIDETWVDKNDVEWLEKSIDVEREEKLKKILN